MRGLNGLREVDAAELMSIQGGLPCIQPLIECLVGLLKDILKGC